MIVFSSFLYSVSYLSDFIVWDFCSPLKFPHIAFPLISLGAGTYNSPQMIWVEVSASVSAPPWPNHLLMPPYSVQYISCYSSTRHNVIVGGSFQPEVNSPFTRGSKMTFFNTKPWSHHKCSQLLFFNANGQVWIIFGNTCAIQGEIDVSSMDSTTLSAPLCLRKMAKKKAQSEFVFPPPQSTCVCRLLDCQAKKGLN